jgi:lipopolysaccharide biosynthesis protein
VTFSPSYIAISGQNKKTFSKTKIIQDNIKLIAFYLPQFHKIPENDEWWGKGFTEWTNVAKAKPNFNNHYQPNVPKDLGFYDLSDIEVIREQASYAKLYGIHAFCFYYYWFSGQKILQKPINNFLNSDISINFCFCWANENWTRTWDGLEKDILLEQKYLNGDEEKLIQSLAESFKDKRYIRVANKPLFIIYRINALPNPKVSILKWQNEAKRLGFEGLHIVVVDFYDVSTPQEFGADALVEFPPHKFNMPENQPGKFPTNIKKSFVGGIVDYLKIIEQSICKKKKNFTLYRGIIPSWDNTPRRQDSSTVIINSSPKLYGLWLKFLRKYTDYYFKLNDEKLIFINAWNEWGEGAYLEPDLRWGTSYLEETYKSSFYLEDEFFSSNSINKEINNIIRILKKERNEVNKKIINLDNNISKKKNFIIISKKILLRTPLLYKFCRKIYYFFK